MSNDLNIKFKEEKYIIPHYSHKINKSLYFTWLHIHILLEKQIIEINDEPIIKHTTIFPKPIG